MREIWQGTIWGWSHRIKGLGLGLGMMDRGFLQTKTFLKFQSGRVTANFRLVAHEAKDLDREAEKQMDTRIHVAIGFTKYVAIYIYSNS